MAAVAELLRDPFVLLLLAAIGGVIGWISVSRRETRAYDEWLDWAKWEGEMLQGRSLNDLAGDAYDVFPEEDR